MKICFIVGSYPPEKCGIGDYTKLLAQELKGNYVDEIHVITSSCGDYLKGELRCGDITVHALVEQWNFKALNIIKETIKSIEPDIIHFQFPSDKYGKSFFINLLPSILKRNFSVKIVETVHEYVNYSYKGKLKNLINYRAADSILVVEERYIEDIKAFAKTFSKKLSIKYIPISSNIPKTVLSKEELKSIKLSYCKEDTFLISFFGFINELKGLEVLLEALKQLSVAGDNVKLLCLAALDYENNQYHNKLYKLVKDYGIEDKVIFSGFIKEPETVANLIAASDLCVLPFNAGVSERNGSFLAALNQGVNTITTSKEKKGFEKEQGVYYIPCEASEELVKAIKYFLANKVEGKQNSMMTWEEIAKAHFKVYEDLLLKK